MKRLKRILTIICCISAGLPILVYASVQYRVPFSVIGRGGGVLTSENYRIKGTVGQPLIGHTSSSSHIIEGGFWYFYKKHFEPILVEDNTLPKQFRLLGNFPNPFNPQTTISYLQPFDCHVKLVIYDIQGKMVRVLADEYKSTGYQSAIWDGRDNQGKLVGSGIYIYRLKAGKFTRTKRMLFLK